MDMNIKLVDKFQHLSKEDTEFSDQCIIIASDVASGKLTIVQLVEELGSLLVDASVDNRELGTWILSKVLETLPESYLDNNQLTFMCRFYADRLKDQEQVIPAVLSGIIALAKFMHFPNGAATEILSALFNHVVCQKQQQKCRELIYKIFEILLERQTTEICTMGFDFVYGVISAVDGERDPRNLLFLFNWFPKFFKTVELKHLTEEAFEIICCYFPVDFKAPEKTNTLTRDTLADALASCLCSIAEFGNLCLPLALEKLDSSFELAKSDSLKLLEIGCKMFDTSLYIQHSTEVWTEIYKILLNNPSRQLESNCYSALSAVIRKISQEAILNEILSNILDTVKRNLIPDSKLFECSSKILLCVAGASIPSSDYVIKEVAPILINTFNITTSPAHKVVILKNLILFYEGYVKLHDYRIQLEDLNVVPVLCLKASIDENSSLRVTGFESLTRIASLLPLDVRLSVYENLIKILVIPQEAVVRETILSCFENLASCYPEEIKENVIRKINVVELVSLESYLDALCYIAFQNYFTSFVVDTLLSYLSQNSETSIVAINAFYNLSYKYEDNENMQKTFLEKHLLYTLIDWTMDRNDVQENCLEKIIYVLKSVVGYETSNQQTDVLSQVLPKIMNLRETGQLCTYVSLLNGLLCRLKRDVNVNYDVIDDLTLIALNEEDSFVKNATVQLLANLVNKCQNDNFLATYLDKLAVMQQEKSANYITLCTWITKALVMRNHKQADVWTDKLIDLLKDDVRVAPSFGIILNDSFDALSTKSCCIKTLLYQQKFFITVTNKLNERYEPQCVPFLSAIVYLLEHTPKPVILMQFKKILKLVISCLDQCEESEVLLVLLQVLKDLIFNKESCIEDNFSEFLDRLSKLSIFEKSMKVRILALQCLQAFTCNFPVYKLLPYRQKVLKVLGKCIDDKKRFVRREAVEARASWFLMDAS